MIAKKVNVFVTSAFLCQCYFLVSLYGELVKQLLIHLLKKNIITQLSLLQCIWTRVSYSIWGFLITVLVKELAEVYLNVPSTSHTREQ